MAAMVFNLLASKNISVDMIIQSQRCRVVQGMATRDIAFTVARMDAELARSVLEQATDLNYGEIVVDAAIAKVSVVGSGMVGQPGVAARMFAALAEQQINIQMIATSEIKVSCVVAEADGVKALQLIHEAFKLSGSQKIEVPA
jgi:aspartate kinase